MGHLHGLGTRPLEEVVDTDPAARVVVFVGLCTVEEHGISRLEPDLAFAGEPRDKPLSSQNCRFQTPVFLSREIHPGGQRDEMVFVDDQ